MVEVAPRQLVGAASRLARRPRRFQGAFDGRLVLLVGNVADVVVDTLSEQRPAFDGRRLLHGSDTSSQQGRHVVCAAHVQDVVKFVARGDAVVEGFLDRRRQGDLGLDLRVRHHILQPNDSLRLDVDLVTFRGPLLDGRDQAQEQWAAA